MAKFNRAQGVGFEPGILDEDLTIDEVCIFEQNKEEDEYTDLKEELGSYLLEANRSFDTKVELLTKNYEAESSRPSLAEMAKRDSAIKKNSSFIKKLRNFGATQIDLMIKECQSLNLTKYLSEAAIALGEARKKFTDIPYLVQLCTELNCIYAEFASFLQEEYIKILTVNKNEPVANANRLRVELCFYAELSLCAVIPHRHSLPVLGTALTALSSDKTFSTLNLILSFCKYCGTDFAGLVPRRVRLLCEQFDEPMPSSTLLAKVKQASVRSLLQDYYKSLSKHLHNEQEKLTEYDKQNRQILMAKGELRPERVTNAEMRRTEIQNILKGVITLAELLDAELPDLPETVSDLDDLALSDSEDCNTGLVWEDNETRRFYTELPDVKEYMTLIQDQASKKTTAVEGEFLNVEDSDNLNKKVALNSFLKLLSECSNKEAIDNAALEYLLYFNSKSSCKKLIVTLYTVPRNKLDLLPFYARFVAILNPVLPEIATTLCQQLRSEMLRHINKKDQVNVESKRKTVKFIGELVNFGVYAKKNALQVLKMLLFDFTHHNIEMFCNLLDTCGCVLHASSDTHISTKYYLEQMLRLKTMMTMEARYVTLIENTYYQILPPEAAFTTSVVQLTPMQQFISHIIYQDLKQTKSEEVVLGVLRSLAWENEEVFRYTVNCLTNASNLSYPHIRSLASVLSMLVDYQEDAVCQVVDGVLEDVRLGMELNQTRYNQRRVAMIKYLGELYNYRLLETSCILNVLYSLISFGVSLEQDELSAVSVDPPNSVIRLHLVLLLLSTCAFPLNNTDTVNKLDCFIIYFQYYYWIKRDSQVWTEEQPFPSDIIYRFEDVLETLNPDLKLAKNLGEAFSSLENLNFQVLSEISPVNQDLSFCTITEDYEGSDPDEGEEVRGMESILQEEKDTAESEFLQELSKVVSESAKEIDTNKIKPNIDIAVPLNYKKILEVDKPQFVILLKKGNKQTCKTLTLPADHEFIIGLKSRQKASKEEKESFKRLTLDINNRLQDE